MHYDNGSASPVADLNVACSNAAVESWLKEAVSWLEPRDIAWIDGSPDQYKALCSQLVADGVFTPLNEQEYPNSFWCRSHPSDVARVEDRTFICSSNREDAGPTNNWCDPGEMYGRLREVMRGCMKGRTMYVVPYLMGPDGSPFARVGFELTDSAYVVVNMSIMARVGAVALKNLAGDSTDFVRGVHSIGTLDPELRYICHFPQDKVIISFNSNYGGNALQGKKCFALRIASTIARSEGWLAEHMLILGIESPEGEKRYFCAAFPSACGKTNLAMLVPPERYRSRGWKLTTVGDDIAWLNFGPDGRLYAINPEAGFFGVAPGTSLKTNPNALMTARANTIFTNTALDLETMTPWWEGLGTAPSKLRSWLGANWDPADGSPAAHPNSRFTSPARQCPCIDSAWESPAGVPISGIIFGGRRARIAPLVYEARNWQHGVFVGATLASKTTAAAQGAVGKLRRDPMAMLPFCGYHMADYFQHWLAVGRRPGAVLPKIFGVNWFRQNSAGKYLWPGFSDNMRVLEWVFRRVSGRVDARETALGLQPHLDDIDLDGLAITTAEIDHLLAIAPEGWAEEIDSQRSFFESLGDRFPRQLWDEHHALKARLKL